ncbi:MAG: hypothetical protein HY975_03560 [Candidatus Kerfeldbacteria bacterium]|nr:hypothetical protein [Candidatus Kerfeldbacteria bacterium]
MHTRFQSTARSGHAASWLAVLCIIASFGLTRPVAAISRTAVIQETNRVRTGAHLNRLLRSTTLERAAVAKAESMFRQQYFGHTSPTGQNFWFWLGPNRSRFSQLGENIARGYKNERILLQDWMKSGGHRANILGPAFTHLGIGIRSGRLSGKRVTVIVQLFGKKKVTTALTTATN